MESAQSVALSKDGEFINQHGDPIPVNPTLIDMTLSVGETVIFRDHTGLPIFTIGEDGSLHGITGGSIVFDL